MIYIITTLEWTRKMFPVYTVIELSKIKDGTVYNDSLGSILFFGRVI